MQGVASVDICRELYHLSGWKGQYWWWTKRVYGDGSEGYQLVGEHEAPFTGETIPAYDASYLAAMLPAFRIGKEGNGSYRAGWMDYANHKVIMEASRTSLANAMGRLAISLFKHGILLADDE